MVKKTRYIKPKDINKTQVVMNEITKKESLPLPFVHYPNYCGTFIGFSKSENSELFFCNCSKLGIENFIKINFLISNDVDIEKNKRTMLIPGNAFPSKVFNSIKKENFNLSNIELKFEKNICHKCNLSTPSVRFTSESYGGNFKQYFGWYIRQEQYKSGIQYNLEKFNFITDFCPNEYVDRIGLINDLNQAKNQEYLRLLEMTKGPLREDIKSDEITFFRNVKISESINFRNLTKEYNNKLTKLLNEFENNVRKEFGFNKIGEGWISESISHKIIMKLFSKYKILRNYRPDWLNGLELDIYIPELKLGFEYQGKQHYYPVEAWGGLEALIKVQERDREKKKICENLKIELIIIDYTESLTEENIKNLTEYKF